MKKVLKVIGIVLASIIALVALVLLAAHLLTPVIYGEFFGSAEKVYLAPGLSSDFIQQGYTFVSDENVFLHSGYMLGGGASRIYVVDGNDTKNVRYIELKCADGSDYTGHVGGITSSNGFLWIADNSDKDHLWSVPLKSVLECENGGSISLSERFYVDCDASFCCADGEYVWVGEFNNDGKYMTSQDHNFNVANGETNRAIVIGYRIDTGTATGISDAAPEKVLSVTNKVQGIAFVGERIVLSTSYGPSTSHLFIYKNGLDGEPDSSITLGGAEVPVWYLDADSLENDVSLQPMSEEITVRDGKIYVSFESASRKYIFGNFMRGRHVYAYEP